MRLIKRFLPSMQSAEEKKKNQVGKRCDLRRLLKPDSVIEQRILFGNSFQRRGPATDRERSPACFLDRGTVKVIVESDRRAYVVL